MKILILTYRNPYPPIDGVRIKTYNLIEQLARRGHDVHLLSFSHDSLERKTEARKDLEALCKTVRFIQVPSDVGRLFCNAVSSFPKLDIVFSRFRSHVFRQALLDAIAGERFDIVHIDGIVMAQYVESMPSSLPSILSVNDSYSQWLRDRLFVRPHPDFYSISERVYYACTYPLATKYEATRYKLFRRIHVVSDVDKAYLLSLDPNLSIDVVPNGVDTEYFKPIENHSEDRSLLAMLSHFTRDHADDALWFIRDVFKIMRSRYDDARLLLVGANTTPFLDSERRKVKGVEATGFVRDFRPYLQNAGVVVDPSRKRGGILNHVLQSMAMGKAVIGTTHSFAAIVGAKHSTNVVIAHDKQAFLANWMALLDDENKRKSIGVNARELVKSRYQWSLMIDKYEKMYRKAAGEAREEENLRITESAFGT